MTARVVRNNSCKDKQPQEATYPVDTGNNQCFTAIRVAVKVNQKHKVRQET